MQSHEPHTSSPTMMNRERDGLVSGRAVLLFSAIVLFVGVPLMTWITLRWVESQQPAWIALNYEQRENWQVGPVRVTDLTNTGFLQPPGSASYRNIRFDPNPQEVQAIHELRRALYASDTPELTQDHPITPLLDDALDVTGFYPAFLLGQWLRQQEDDSHHEAFSHAFAHAPKALILRFVTETGDPAANLRLGTLTIICARTTDEGELDESLQLVYPNLTTDADGRVYLPVYDAPLRLAHLPEQTQQRNNLTWPDAAHTWFDFPGRVGMMNPTVVENTTSEH